VTAHPVAAEGQRVWWLQYLVNKLAWYYALNGINILLLIGRVLKRMDFQPRLGVVTRSLALAGPDLIHFCLVCGMVFVGYAMMAHLIFGNTIQVSRSCQSGKTIVPVVPAWVMVSVTCAAMALNCNSTSAETSNTVSTVISA